MESIIKPQNLELTREQLTMLLPYLILIMGGMLTLLMTVFSPFKNNIKTVAFAAVGVLVLALLSSFYVWGEPGTTLFNKMMAADYFTNLFNMLFISTTILVILSSISYLDKEELQHGEYYTLLLFSCLGMMLLSSALDLIVLFVALEIMSLAVYVLVGFRRVDAASNEAAVKYFILGGAASAIMLYGVALVYGATGSMNILEIAQYFTSNTSVNSLLSVGVILVLTGFLFKVAAVPFHMWMPDVYQGAPTSVTGFMTTGLKAAAFAAFLRLLIGLGYPRAQEYASSAFNWVNLNSGIHNAFWLIAVITMFVGNVVALTQTNLKRMLAYSSIAHTGYILIGLLSGAKSEFGYTSVILYLITYVVMNLGAFTIIALMSDRGDQKINVDDFAGLGFKRPMLGAAMAIFMFSMAGIPPTAGFAGKYLIFSAAVQSGEIWLAILGVLCSSISAYYYLRVIVVMYMKDPIHEFHFKNAFTSALVIFVTAFATLEFGVFPSALIEIAKKAAMHI